ncbi:MAG: hypothetical protein QT03_C0001G1348 [archaeon GW2011_AR10]|uniref:Type II toxin-antitoxin system HicB family antitoxin n=1 Tax=Candidatus Iainarchaeum sp. TaxID=3101447 RepID=A0A7J4IVV2_9ARCH|nr:MAG: hypothetical protein QT03_C0001G1348 [archaeon GW2011_AR10]HIH07847.1 type II toxin-antitoxin system HicB family antitoxin [Candidatus Diapherotrites archaeon]
MGKSYKIVVEKGFDGYLVAEVPEFPGCYTQAKTMKELMYNAKEAIELYLESEKELKRRPQKRFLGIKEVVINA